MEVVVRLDLSMFTFKQLDRFLSEGIITVFEWDLEMQSRGFDGFKRKMVLEGILNQVA